MQPVNTDVSSMSTMQRLSLIRASEAVLRKSPKNIDALVNLGVLLTEEKRYADALEYFKKALAAKKKDLTILKRIVDVYQRTSDFQNSKKYIRKLLELQPRNPEFLVLYGEACEELGQNSQAMATWEKLAQFLPDDPSYPERLANCHRRMGDMASANAIFADIQKRWPGYVGTLYLYANSKKIGTDEAPALLEQIDAGIERSNDRLDKSNLNYAAGKVLTDIGNHDRAFEYYRQANALGSAIPINDLSIPFRNAKSVLTREFVKARPGIGLDSDQPIFILGMPRSGTTLVESFVGGHSTVTAGDELAGMLHIANSFGLRSLSDREFRTKMEEVPLRVYKQFAEEYLIHTRTAHGKTPHFTDKLPHNFLQLGFIKLLFPNAGIIHCRRHPLDNCVSIYTNSMRSFHQEYKSDLSTLGLYYRQYDQLMEHWRQVFPGGFHEVFYEDVVANTELNARAMIDYLGLEWEDEILERKNSQKTVKTLSVWQVRQPVYTSSAGRWTKYEKHLGPLIDALGPTVEAYENDLKKLSEGVKLS